MTAPCRVPNPDNPYDELPTRWEELKERVKEIVEIVRCLTPDGISLYFLNRAPLHNIYKLSQIEKAFSVPPHGYTPLREAYQRVLDEKVSRNERKVMVVIATDGKPNKPSKTKDAWVGDLNGFTQLMKTRGGYDPKRCPTVIMACSDNEEDIGWLNTVDKVAPNVDVLDDYVSERNEVLAAQGNDFPFTEGDYVVKTLLASIDDVYDFLDEKRLSRKQYAAYLGVPIEQVPPRGCCTIM